MKEFLNFFISRFLFKINETAIFGYLQQAWECKMFHKIQRYFFLQNLGI